MLPKVEKKASPPQQDSPGPQGKHWARHAGLALLLLAILVPYLPSLTNGFVYDDIVLIVEKDAPSSISDALSVFTEMHHPSGLQYYRPIAALTLSIQKAIWANSALPYHLLNLFLLECAALAAWLLLDSLGELYGSRRIIPVAFAAFFALHPLVSSTVHAISGRETLLVVIFMALSCWAFLGAGRLRYLSALLLFALALLCKEQAVALPLVFVLADWLGMTKDSPRRILDSGRSCDGANADCPADLLQIAGCRTTASVYDVVVRTGAWVKRYALVLLIVAGYFDIRSRVFAAATGNRSLGLALFDEPLRPLLSLAYSLQSVFLPTAELHYEPHLVAWWSTWRFLATAVAVSGLVWLAVRFAKPRSKPLLFWVGWSLATIAPSANILSQETYYAERYVVLPLLGVVGFAAVVAGEIWVRSQWRRWLALTIGLAVVVLGLLSSHRGQYFENDYRFLTQWAASDPMSHQARASLGEYHRERQEFEEAVVNEREAVSLIDKAVAEPLCAKRHYALAYVLWKTGRYDEAIAQCEEILRMSPNYPKAREFLDRIRSDKSLAE